MHHGWLIDGRVADAYHCGRIDLHPIGPTSEHAKRFSTGVAHFRHHWVLDFLPDTIVLQDPQGPKRVDHVEFIIEHEGCPVLSVRKGFVTVDDVWCSLPSVHVDQCLNHGVETSDESLRQEVPVSLPQKEPRVLSVNLTTWEVDHGSWTRVIIVGDVPRTTRVTVEKGREDDKGVPAGGQCFGHEGQH